MNTHIIYGLVVLAILSAGWLVVVYLIAKRAKGRRERSFTMRAGVATLLGILFFSALDTFVFKSHGAAIGAIMFITFFILRRRQLAIRREEANA